MFLSDTCILIVTVSVFHYSAANVIISKQTDGVEVTRMLGLDLGDEHDNRTAGIWLIALVLTLTSALPALLLNSSLAFRRRSTGSARIGADFAERIDDIARLVDNIENYVT